jgi:hypothetical protein
MTEGEAKPASRLRRFLAPVAVGLAVVAAALAVIVWLPLDAEVESDVKEALVGYETAREVAWPASQPIDLPLTVAEQAALADDLRRGLSSYAGGDALAGSDARGAVEAFAFAAMQNDPWVVTRWDGEVVFFDFVRQSLRGDVIVRAGVRRAHQSGRMKEARQRIVALRWVWDDGADINEYTLRDTGDTWKVVAATHWGVCGPDGEDVVEGRQSF